MMPDPGCYEERYRPTGQAALGLAVGLVSVAVGIVWHPSTISAAAVILGIPVAFSVAAIVLAVPGMVALGRRVIAFRADYAGVTFGAVPDNWTFFRTPPVFVPWGDVERIVFYGAHPRVQGVAGEADWIGVQRRAGVLDLPWGNERAPGCPVPGVAAGAARKITGWRLDRERLAAVVAAVAPGVPVADVSTGAGRTR
jgi:hypothetical protein